MQFTPWQSVEKWIFCVELSEACQYLILAKMVILAVHRHKLHYGMSLHLARALQDPKFSVFHLWKCLKDSIKHLFPIRLLFLHPWRLQNPSLFQGIRQPQHDVISKRNVTSHIPLWLVAFKNHVDPSDRCRSLFTCIYFWILKFIYSHIFNFEM